MSLSIVRSLSLGAALLALAGCGPSGQERSKAAAAKEAGKSPHVSSATISPPPAPASPEDFVAKASASDLFEVQAAQLAEARASNPAVKSFAAIMRRDHTRSSQDLKKAIAESGRSLVGASALNAEQQKALADITTAAPADFDRTYMESQVKAHGQALALMQAYAEQGDVPSLKAFASQASSAVQHHYQQARALAEQLQR